MPSTTTFAYVTRLPEVDTNRIAQLQLAIAWWEKQYREAQMQVKLAWAVYGDAVDDPNATKDDRDGFYGMGTLFEGIAMDAWQEWQTAKQNLLVAWG